MPSNETLTLTVQRFHPQRQPNTLSMSYTVPKTKTLLQALTHIKRTQDPTLTFNAGCNASVCGSCAVRVNGREVLACAYTPQEGDLIEPLRYATVLKDLVVDASHTTTLNARAHNASHGHKEEMQSIDAAHAITRQSDCILCSACYSACPVLAVNSDFLGPFALTRSWRYIADSREADTSSIMQSIQTNGIWDCTLCGECTTVCPQHIDPKNDIMMLQGKAGILGYTNPKFGGGMSFDGGFGTPDFGVPSF